MMIWPWAPMLNSPARKASATPRPALISGVAMVRVSVSGCELAGKAGARGIEDGALEQGDVGAGGAVQTADEEVRGPGKEVAWQCCATCSSVQAISRPPMIRASRTARTETMPLPVKILRTQGVRPPGQLAALRRGRNRRGLAWRHPAVSRATTAAVSSAAWACLARFRARHAGLGCRVCGRSLSVMVASFGAGGGGPCGLLACPSLGGLVGAACGRVLRRHPGHHQAQDVAAGSGRARCPPACPCRARRSGRPVP